MSTPDTQLEMTIHRYILGQLTEAEALEFEASYLSDPDVISVIESELALRQGLVVAEKRIFNKNAEPQFDANTEPWYRKLLNCMISPIAVPALTLPLFAVFVIPFVSITSDESSNLDNIMIVNGAMEVTRTITGPQEYMPMELSAPEQTASAVLIKVQTSSQPYETYRLKVVSAENNKTVWTSTPFKLNSLNHGLVIVPDKAAISDAVIKVVAIADKGGEVDVKFCHYSEVCR